jgi:hypothetical protein
MLRWTGRKARSAPFCVLMSLKSNSLLYEHIFPSVGVRRVSEGFVSSSGVNWVQVSEVGANGITSMGKIVRDESIQ